MLDNDTNTVVRISCFVGLGIEIWKIHKVSLQTYQIKKQILTHVLLGDGCKIGRYQDFGLHSSHPVHGQGLVRVNKAVRPAGLQVSVVVVFPSAGRLLRLLTAVRRAQGMVLVGAVHALWFPAYLRLHHDDAPAVHQLQTQVCRTSAMAHDELQIPQHFHRRYLRFRYQDANYVPPWLLQRWLVMIFFPQKKVTLKMLMCLSDIVFFIFLYQRWIYKIDPSRLNEFGFSAEMEKDAKVKGAIAPGEAAIAPGEEPKPIEDKKKD